MAEINISDRAISEVEKLLLPENCHFANDSKDVIRHWKSVDVVACPGSGKTTVLLAKLKLLADRMPLEDGAGICVLSHTNVAVDEIKRRLGEYADQLRGYPNYVGTIQSFIDRFVTVPYLRDKSEVSISFVDEIEYCSRLYSFISRQTYPNPYYSLFAFVNSRFKTSSFPYADEVHFFQDISIRNDGLYHRNSRLAGNSSDSYKQYIQAKGQLLRKHGILQFHDTYAYVNEAVSSLSNAYTCLFSKRFKYVFIDEYQDCNNVQREALNRLFDPAECNVFRIGDTDQAIYGSINMDADEWIPSENSFEIASTCRYGQSIADVISPLRRSNNPIHSCVDDSLKPTVIVFDEYSINKVIGTFVGLLEKKGLNNLEDTYKVIGAIRSDSTSGLSIGSYWEGFDSRQRTVHEYSYWDMIGHVLAEIKQGRLYRAENLVRKILCRIFHYLGIRDKTREREYTVSSIQTALRERHWDIYSNAIINLAEEINPTIDTVDLWIRGLLGELIEGIDTSVDQLFEKFPANFMEKVDNLKVGVDAKNIYVDPIRGRKIEFDTIHGAKGQTHDATLYLETEKSNGSDIGRILWCYGIGSKGKSTLYDQSRKLAYVGMSRPRKFLCVAVQSKTFEKGKEAFNNWEIVDIRGTQ